ncbi:MAG: hydrogenase iron-sulfur subunit [Candidatus Helarchaeota archaeon]|nr:hydrogenase iron-sulfur subunit [Candidatus Helarchaeota archaeon]
MSFEPKILGILCNWCSYAGADLAGVSRVQYPTNIRVIRVMCSGRVDPIFVIEALKRGIDGIIVMGCHLGDCHYISGNYEAEMKYNLIEKLLELVHLSDRVRLEWVSASEGVRFGKVVTEFTEHIKTLGPSPLKQASPDSELVLNLNALGRAAVDDRLRALVARKRLITLDHNVYDKKIPLEEFESIQNQAIFDEFIRQKAYLLLQSEPLSVKDLAGRLEIDAYKVLKHVITLRQRGSVALDRIEGVTPYYFAITV